MPFPYSGTVEFARNQANHPNGHFCLIGDDGLPYIGGVSDHGGELEVFVGSIDESIGDLFTIDEATWQSDFATWRSENEITIAGTFHMGQGAVPVSATPFFYIPGYQITGVGGSELAAGCALCCWLRYRIVDSSTLVLDGVLIYKTGPEPAFEAVTDVNWGWSGALIEDTVYSVMELSRGIAVGAGGDATGPGIFLVEIPLSGSVVSLDDNIWSLHITRFGPTTNFLVWATGENNRVEVAIFKDPEGIGILTYQGDGENSDADIPTSGCEYWVISDRSVVVDQIDKRIEFEQPWDDSGKLYSDSDSPDPYIDDYGAPTVNHLSNGNNELLFSRIFSDNLTKVRVRRYIQNPLTGSISFDNTYETDIAGVPFTGEAAVTFREPDTGHLVSAIVWQSWLKWTLGPLTVDPCVFQSGFTDDDLVVEELACDAEWPFDDLKPINISIIPVQASIGGGLIPSGSEQVEVAEDPAAFPESSPAPFPSIAGFWRVHYDGVPLRTITQVRRWREMQSVLNGRQGVCCVPLYDGKRAPWAGENVVAEADNAAFVGDTQIDIHVTTGSSLEIGMHFSAAERAYRIVEVSGGPSVFTCMIWPPLRADIAQNDSLEFEHPICRMRLAKDDGMTVQLDLMRYAAPSVEWVEDI